MADVTISGLSQGSPTTSVVLPWSDGVSTYQAKLSSLITATGSMGTGFIQLPTGTSSQRVGTPAVGAIRYNTTINAIEWYDGTIWSGDPLVAQALIIAGGGSGGSGFAGGGGAGGVVFASTLNLNPKTAYNITVGKGGNATTARTAGNIGNNSEAFGFTAIGGGGGAAGNVSGQVATTGGSGGGGSGEITTAGAAGTPGQGNAGGNGFYGANNYPGGGGGGAGGAGQSAPSGSTAGVGGIGTALYSEWGAATNTGQNVNGIYYYAGGGGGSTYQGGSAAVGGLGGGGSGSSVSAGGTGTANTGGGGGAGAWLNGNFSSGAGGSGIVIIRYQGNSVRATGGTIFLSNGYIYHAFTTIGASTFLTL